MDVGYNMHPVQHAMCNADLPSWAGVRSRRSAGTIVRRRRRRRGALVGEMRAFRGGRERAGRSAAVTGCSVPSRYIISVRLFFVAAGGAFCETFFLLFRNIIYKRGGPGERSDVVVVVLPAADLRRRRHADVPR
jgi:hypothetical protein